MLAFEEKMKTLICTIINTHGFLIHFPVSRRFSAFLLFTLGVMLAKEKYRI